jgi:hypothetical protein
MKVELSDASCRVTTTWWNSGSVLRGDYATGLESLHTDLRVGSPAPEADVARLIRMAERACYVLSALDRPPTPTTSIMLNGAPFAVGLEAG